jgi:hypothetical protein
MYWALPQDPDFKYLAGLQGLQRDESIWDMRPDVIQIVRSWADDQDSDVPARHVLLIANVLVYCDEDVKVLFSQGQQLPTHHTFQYTDGLSDQEQQSVWPWHKTGGRARLTQKTVAIRFGDRRPICADEFRTR